MNKLISDNAAKIKSIDQLICEKKIEIEKALLQKKVQLQSVQLLAFGSTGNSSVFSSHNAICFVLEANNNQDK